MTFDLRTQGHDDRLDFIKGVCIFWVVLNHCLPLLDKILFPFWGAMAVPIFLLIQALHVLRKAESGRTVKYSPMKVLKRIIAPYAAFQLATVAIMLIFTPPQLLNIVNNLIRQGGIGPGSYYVWIYLQFWLVLPLCVKIIHRFERYHWLIFLSLSIAAEIACSIANIPNWVYRLTAIRYIFLIPLGWYLATHEIKVTMKLLLLSVLSVLSIAVFQYTTIDFSPIFYNSWRMFKWLSYFYPAFLLIGIICAIYLKVGDRIKRLFCNMGKCSYEIFMLQMLIFACYPHSMMNHLFGTKLISGPIFILITITTSIFPCMLWRSLKTKFSSYDKN